MGGGTSGDPPIGPTEDSGPSSSGDKDSEQTGIDDHTSSEDPKETETPSGSTPAGGAGGGVPVAPPPATGEPQPEETERDNDEDSEPEVPEIEPESDTSEGEQEPFEESDSNEDSDDTEDEDDDDEQQVAQVLVHSDPWDNVGLGLYPIRYQLKEEYGDQVQIDDRLIPVREFDSPEEMAHKWEQETRRHGMPVDPSVWNHDPPKSTEIANRAYAAAREQGIQLAKDYMRRLRMAAIVEGRNIDDRETLLELGKEVGLNIEQLERDWDDVEVRKSKREVNSPRTTIYIDGETITQSGYLHVDDIKMMLEQAGFETEKTQSITGFVDEYGPVAVQEVCQVYNLDEDTTLERLRNMDNVVPVEYGQATLWTSR